MRVGVRIGIDVGRVRIGVSRSDPLGILATPYETVLRALDGRDITKIHTISLELEAMEIVVGLPLSLSGSSTASTDDAQLFAVQIANGCDIPVRLVDERLSTVSAQSALHASGRNVKNSRSVIDQAAAIVILQSALDAEQTSGREPGSLVDPDIGGSP